MSGYKELFTGYQLEQSKERTTGQRQFLVITAGPDSLPTIGIDRMIDENGAPVPGCYCRRIRTSYLDQDATRAVKTALFDTDAGGGSGSTGAAISSDKDQEDFYATVESVPIDNPSVQWTFESDGTSVDYPIYKELGIHNWSRIRTDMSAGEYESFKSLVRAHLHTINDADFAGWGVGCVKFIGASGGSYIDQNGTRRYRAMLTFSGRVIKDDINVITTDTWLYLYNPNPSPGSGNAWDKPKSGSNYLYTKTDFTQLV